MGVVFRLRWITTPTYICCTMVIPGYPMDLMANDWSMFGILRRVNICNLILFLNNDFYINRGNNPDVCERRKKRMLKSRKLDHIRINLEENVKSGLTSGLEKFRFVHNALPELDLDDVDLSQVIFNKLLKAPILISSMTGGTPEALEINMALAEAAQEAGIAMGVGSQRAAIEHEEVVGTFKVRRAAPDILLFANLGAVQLNYGYDVDHCRRAVEMIEADALILHLNPIQEAIQPEGDVRFSNLLSKIETVCHQLEVPVIAKEIGWGISKDVARRLSDAGVAAIDVAGAGGTSWSKVEMHRVKDRRQARIASAFHEWGISTADSIQNVRLAAPETMIFASGGIHNGVEIAKCLTLGAVLGGMAGPFLAAATRSKDEVSQLINEFWMQMRICFFAVGIGSIAELQAVHPLEPIDGGGK